MPGAIERQNISGVNEQTRRKAEIITLTMGSDFGTTVGVGPRGSGWHWDFAKNHTNMDAGDLEDEPLEVILGIASHEGSHRLVSRPEHVMDLWSQPGFSFGFNACEDPRANEGGMRQRPGARRWIHAYIERDLSPGGGLDYEGIKKSATDSVGYVPKFMQWGSEMIHYWYRKELTKDLQTPEDREAFLQGIPDEDVRSLVADTLDDFEEFYKAIPDHPKDELDVQKAAKASCDVFRNKIWPKYKELVDKSFKDQSMADMVKDMISQGNPQQGQGQGGQTTTVPFESLPQDVQDEIRQKIKDHQQKQKDQKQQVQPGNKGQAQQPQQGVDQQAQQGESSGGQSGQEQEQEGQDGAGSATGDMQGGAKKDSKGQQAGQSQGQAGSQEGMESGDQVSASQQSSGAGQATDTQASQQQAEEQEGAEEGKPQIPWDQLSERAKKAVEDAYDLLPEDAKEQYEKQAQEDLQNAEDAANEKLRGEMNDPRYTETHKERKEREQKEQQKAQNQHRDQAITQQMQQDRHEAAAQITANPYHEFLTLPDVDEIRRRLDRDFKRIFEPTEEPTTRYTSSGLQASMRRAMQMDADPRKSNIFETKGRPTAKDYRFVFLIDLSPSMTDKIEETFKIIVALSEVMNKYGIESSIVGFTDSFPGAIKVYKSFEQKKLTRADRDRIGEMLADCRSGSGTPTLEATQETYRILSERMRRYPIAKNYFVTLTDGQPTSSTPEDLLTALLGIRQDRRVVTSGYGIGPGTEFVNNAYPVLHERILKEIARTLRKNIDEVGNSFSDAVEFSKAFDIIIRYMVKNPELFFK